MYMNQERGHIPYLDKEGREIDWESQRLRYWMETVPKEVRRLEYDLWKKYKQVFLINVRMRQNVQQIGRFKFFPSYEPGDTEADWKEFQDSFLHGRERKDRFAEILEHAHAKSAEFARQMEESSPISSPSDVLLTALTSSAVYGPRKKGTFLSDIDVNFLLKDPTDELNFEVMPREKDDPAYHLVGTGYTDASRLDREQIHWLLYPHYPIENHVPDNQLREVVAAMADSTLRRRPEIEEEMSRIDQDIEDMKKGGVSRY
jgi:hypothetical protein